jgi:hypothetical protein
MPSSWQLLQTTIFQVKTSKIVLELEEKNDFHDVDIQIGKFC